jgi:hypothetical protein
MGVLVSDEVTLQYEALMRPITLHTVTRSALPSTGTFLRITQRAGTSFRSVDGGDANVTVTCPRQQFKKSLHSIQL